MKNLTPFFCCTILILGFATPTKAQGWEIFVLDPSFVDISFHYKLLSGGNNGVRIAHQDIWNTPLKMLNYDANGDFIGNEGIPGTNDWELIQSDKSGATYWEGNYKIRKIDVNNQIVWTYNTSAIAGIFWASQGPNGSTYVKYSENNSNEVIDAINKDGILEHRFNFNSGWPLSYLPTGDFGIIYTDDLFGSVETWTKLDHQGNLVWSKDLEDIGSIRMGSIDGSTYLTNSNYELVKLDATGNIVWIKPMDLSNPSINTYPQSVIELSDGSIAILSTGYDSSKEILQITKINAQTGALIWEKRASSSLEGLVGIIYFFEMADGGLLASIGTINNTDESAIFLMRTDQNGNILTNQINGRIYRDENADCQWQNTENAMKQVSIIAQSGSKIYSATTDSLGNFSMATGSGNYEIRYGQLGSYWDLCTMPSVSLAGSNDTVVLNTGVRALVNCPELVVSIGSNVFRRCFDNNYLNISYQNIGSAPAENAYVELFLDPKLEFLSATPIAAIQNGQTFRFELGTLAVGASGQISVNFKVDCNAEIEEILCASAHIYPDTLCLPVAPRHSENQFCLPVVASYDPNDKTAFLNGRPEFSKILPNEELEYLIRFQNTGNDTAFNIVIVDTLTTYLDASSVLPGVSSHPYSFELDKGHILRFSFRNILLPDSNTNEVASHGFVKFRVHQNPNNVLGNEIKNSAAIFFDYNAPIITNETNLKISIPSRTADLENRVYAQIFPIPAREKVQVSLKNADAGTVLWRMFDATGKLISNGQSSGTTGFDIPRNGQPSGVYYCQFLMENGQTVFGKVIFD
jgi:uncharacterized repeat protein (TIGR01451 family)